MREDLPTGAVTLLFSDVEGSTTLLHELGAEAYADALTEHRRIVREACTAERGVEVDNQGDAFFFAFHSAPGAITAAHAITDALAPGPIQVRIGLHTGSPFVTDEGYVGDDVHLAARVGASGHGGQVLVSSTTRDFVDGLSLTDLGEHRLKDIPEAVSIFQLGGERFPPLKTISNTNLPRPASSFIGRKRELRELLDTIRSARLVTLTGPGGSGKTRLAIEVAAELVPAHRNGVFWVGLAPLRDPALVTATIAGTLGAKDGLAEHIAERELLLLLDNLEQVVDAAPELASLVEDCPNLRLLVTSRELLRVRGEVEYPVDPLAEAEAVELFCRRSRLAPDAAIAELCRRLDDLPLAVELAAARTSVLSPAQIVERLGQQLDLLKGGRDAEARQQTLRATIEWSYDLLQADEQRLFRGLAVFSGGCTLEAAEHVVDAKLDTLQSLVNKNLLRHADGRFWMLETIRDYALERLEAADHSEEVRRRHAAFVLALAESANLSGEAEGPQHHELVTLEQDNARAAIEWAWSTGEVALALRLAVALENFWVTRNPFEGMRLFDRLLGAERDVPAVLRARALRAYGSSCHWAGELARAGRLYEESAAIFRAEADELGTVIVLSRLGLNVLERGDPERARSLLEQSLANFRRLGSRRGETQVLGSLGSLELAQGSTRTAAALFEESAAIAAEIGRVWWETSMLSKLAFLALEAGRADEAAARARRILDLTRQTDDRQATVRALAYLACVAADRDDSFDAGRLWGAIEAEEERGRIAAWEPERETLAQSVFARAGPELERGLASGRRLSLEEAVRKTLGT